MSKMKYSGVEWIGDIPCEWKINKLKNVADIYTGNSISDDEKSLYEDCIDAFPYIATKDINMLNSTVNYNNGMYTKYKDKKFKIANSGDTLLCIEGGSAGKKIAKIDCNVSFVNKLCCFHGKLINNVFLYYYLMSDSFKERFNQNIIGLIGGVSQFVLKQFNICIPNIKEQELIANFLDKKVNELDEVLNDLNKQVEILNNYKKSIITEKVTKGFNKNIKLKKSNLNWIREIPENWSTNLRVKDLFVFTNGLSITKEDLVDSGIPVISYGQIHSKMNKSTYIDESLIRYVDDSYLKYIKVSGVKKGDFIFADTSEDLDGCGNFVYVNENRQLFAGYHTIILKSKDNIDNKFLSYLFLTDIWRNQIRSKVYGVKVFSITQKILKESKVILPPAVEQKEIVKFLDKKCEQIDKIIEDKQKQIEKIEEYKKSVIYEYVTGKKRVEGAEKLYG